MKFENKVMPNDDQMAEFLEPGNDQPICMVNLLKFKDKAQYPDKRETTLSGKEAYAIYSEEVKHHLDKIGGKILFGADVKRLMLGEIEELWDSVAIATYPNRKAMLDMISDPEYIKSAQHRVAGLKGQLNIETVISSENG